MGRRNRPARSRGRREARKPPRELPRDGSAFYGTQAVEGPSWTQGEMYLFRHMGSHAAQKFYVCPGCNLFQPTMRAWKAQMPANVRLTYVPAQFGGPWDRYARAYYAAEAMGLVPRTHDLLYNAIHVEQTLKGERGEDSVQDIAAFYARFGVDPQQFASTMSSFAIDGKLRKAKQFAARSAIEGTPTLIVDGKYRVLGRTREDQIRILDQLVAQEQAALGAK